MNRDKLSQIPINRHGNSGVELSYTAPNIPPVAVEFPVENYPSSYHLVITWTGLTATNSMLSVTAAGKVLNNGT